MPICRALLKFGYSNFSLEILEYCNPSKCIKREQYYLDLLKPEYNILEKAGSPERSGFKYSEESKAKISASVKAHQASNPQLHSIRIEVLDLETGNKTIHPSIKAAAIALNCKPFSIVTNLGGKEKIFNLKVKNLIKEDIL